MTFDECKNYIDKVLCEGKGDSFDIAHYLYSALILLPSDDQPHAFQYACEHFGTVESNDSFGITPSKYRSQKDSLRNQYEDVIDSLLNLYIKQNVDESAFYSKLWANVVSSGVFSDEEDQIYALYSILIDKRVPYFHLDSASFYSLSNDRFKQLHDENIQAIQKIAFIMKASFNQKSERASALLSELGISSPADTGDAEKVHAYETKLMQMVEIITSGLENDRSTIQSLLSQIS